MRRSGIAVYVHVVWATWDRLPLLSSELERQVHAAIGGACSRLGAEVIALGGIEDHVHLLVTLPPTVSVSMLVGKVKGASSHLTTHVLLPDGQFFKWQGAYGAVSVSPRHLRTVAAYIAHQKEHHANGTTLPALELPHRQPPPLPVPNPLSCPEAAQAAFVAVGA